jgi:hypothetical protein
MYVIDSWTGGASISHSSQRHFRVCCQSLSPDDDPEYYIETRLLIDPDVESSYRHASPMFERRILKILKDDFDAKRESLRIRESEVRHFGKA